MIQNDHQYETVREALVQLRNKEQPQDQLVFYVGFRHKDCKNLVNLTFICESFETISPLSFLKTFGAGTTIKH